MRILFCGETFPRAPRMLRELLPEEGIASCPSEEVLTRGIHTDVLIPLMHKIEATVIANTEARLIHQWGVGLEGVDIPAAVARGIMVCNVPANATANAHSTAEMAVFLMMAVSRRIHECFRSFHVGRWGSPIGSALLGRTALIVGLGNVGKALARKLVALDMRVEAVRRTPDPEAERRIGIAAAGGFLDLYEMAGSADFVISAVSLAEETRGLFDRRLFKVMKPDGALINVSRGPTVNEEDLLIALREGDIAAAGLDVFADEPLAPTSALLSMSNVVATPHVAGATSQTYEGIASVVRDNIIALKEGRPPRFCVNTL